MFSSASRREPSDSQSEASTTLSDFVRRRYNREVSILGGDPRVGAAELSNAVATSLQSLGLVDAIKDLKTSIKGLSVVSSTGGVASQHTTSPIELQDNAETITAAADLDPSKIQMLLETSMVNSQDVIEYKKLIGIAQASIKDKETSKRSSQMRKKAALLVDSYAPDEELEHFYMKDIRVLTKFLGIDGRFGRDEIHDKAVAALLNRALIHDSVTGGRVTNDTLALMGDSVLQTLLYGWTYDKRIAKGDANAIWQATQANASLRALGVKIGLSEFIVVSPGIDTEATKVMATAVEALFGAVYKAWGMAGVEELNAGTLRVDDFDELQDRYKVKE